MACRTALGLSPKPQEHRKELVAIGKKDQHGFKKMKPAGFKRFELCGSPIVPLDLIGAF
jgi:hypothetical protein